LLVSQHLFHVIGGIYEAEAQALVARTRGEVQEAFQKARRSGDRLSLASGRRSFGTQYLPAPGGKVLDVGELERGAVLVSEDSDGAIWVRAGGGTRFSDLRELFPRFRTYCPPTADAISIAGALAACTHSSAGYFADSVRAFRLECPDGSSHLCERGAPGIRGELFLHAVGAMGALGVMTDIELRLTPIDPDQQIIINAAYAGPSSADAFLETLEAVADDPRYAEGNGSCIYGARGHGIVFADELLPAGERRKGPQALLTGDDLVAQMFSQAFANRLPAFAEWIVSRTYRSGAALWAPWYGFQFFQRSYDAVHHVMGQGSLLTFALRALGMPRRLPVCHVTWMFPRHELRAFVEGYFELMARFPELEKRVEQQDIVLLPAPEWPAHTMGGVESDIGIFTASFSVRRGEDSERRAFEFARTVTREARRFAPGTRISLCKQIHGDGEIVCEMHQNYISLMRRLRAQVDPDGILASRFLTDLGLAG
jgi:FAD/FMN-containing dehydrogenase